VIRGCGLKMLNIFVSHFASILYECRTLFVRCAFTFSLSHSLVLQFCSQMVISVLDLFPCFHSFPLRGNLQITCYGQLL